LFELTAVDFAVVVEVIAHSLFLIFVEFALEDFAVAFESARALFVELVDHSDVDIPIWIGDSTKTHWNVIFEFSFEAAVGLHTDQNSKTLSFEAFDLSYIYLMVILIC
jgi:hypothetical protein